MFRTLLVGAAGIAAATVALAQSEPGAGAPAAPHGEPYAPNASIAPSALPNGGAMGTQANSATNVGTVSADQTDQAQSAQPAPKVKMVRHHVNATSVGGVSDRAPSSRPLPPTTTPPPE